MRRPLLVVLAAASLTACGVPRDGSDGIGVHTASPGQRAATVAAPPVQLTSTRPVGVVPVHVQVPSVHIDAPVVPVGQTPSGDLAVPAAWGDAGWWQGGYRPGQLGHAVIVGHLDTDDAAHPGAAFSNLHSVAPGADVVVAGADGSALQFTVTAVQRYDADHFPVTRVFGPSSTVTLELLTCAGTWRGRALGYSERLVVTAEARP